MDWTQKELEELYQKVNQRALEDAEFRKELQADAHAAIEKVAGRKLPKGFRLETIETDLSYNRTFVAPDFAPGELNIQNLKTAAGGQGEEQLDNYSPSEGDEGMPNVAISIALIVSVCGAAGAIGPCPSDACGAKACAGDACGGNACGADGCAGAACGGDACGGAGCAGVACGGDACGGAGCAGAACGVNACGGNACGVAGCPGAACGGDACGANSCAGAACGGNACGNDGCIGAVCSHNM